MAFADKALQDFPDFAQFLVELGIESISLNPDSVLKTKIAIAETEKKINKNKLVNNMYDIITFGSAAQDIHVKSKAFKF